MTHFHYYFITSYQQGLYFCRHDSKPNIPDIADMDKFCGKILHSRDYRHVESFANQRVAVLGMHYSGEDIAIQVSTQAKRVRLFNLVLLLSPIISSYREASSVHFLVCCCHLQYFRFLIIIVIYKSKLSRI